MKDGINIDQDAVQDQLVPEDLNSLAVGSYEVPDPKIRNRYFFVFLVLSLIFSHSFSYRFERIPTINLNVLFSVPFGL